MAAPPLPPQRSINILIVYGNIIRTELVRSIHVYRGEEIVEREFKFYKRKAYEEGEVGRFITAGDFIPHEHQQGRVYGVWECLFVFDKGGFPFPNFQDIPKKLDITRNRKLRSIPNLYHDLLEIYELGWALGSRQHPRYPHHPPEEAHAEDNPDNGHVPPE